MTSWTAKGYMILFHVSTSLLQKGPQPTPAARVWPTSVKEEVENRLEESRPAQRPSRRTAFYAFESAGHCLFYGTSVLEWEGKELQFYRVEMPDSFRAPMKLTGLPSRIYECHWKQAYEAYWNPDDSWRFWEYLDDEMSVLEQIARPAFTEQIQPSGQFDADRRRLEKMFV